MNSMTLSIILRAAQDILSHKKQDRDYVQVILNLLEAELGTPQESQQSLMPVYRRLFRHYLKIARQPPPDDSAFGLPEMRLESRLTRYLRQALMRISDPKCPIKNQVVLTPEEVLALTALRQTCHRLKEFESHAQLYDFLESTTFSYKPIPALSKYMANSQS
jgi:hypothetical protein